MTDAERAEIARNAVRDYRAAVESGDARKIAAAVNGMENAYICICCRNVPGAEELRKTIRAAKARTV